MSIYRIAYDVMTLATAMLPMLKAQSRITRTDEDAQATEIMARAIGRVERQSGICIAPQEFTWMPRDPTRNPNLSGWGDVWREVEMPVRGFFEVTGLDTEGEAIDYFMVGDADQTQFGRAWIQRRPNGMQPNDLWTIKAGYVDPEEMPAELRDTLVRYAAALWENREAWATQNTDVMPEWVTEALGIFWIPKV